MKDSEQVAKAIIERIIPGVLLAYGDTQAAGEYDFEMRYGDGLVAALEVTVSTDQEVEEGKAAVLNPRKGGSFIPTVQCKKDWWIHPTPAARIKRVRREADRYLSAIEDEGRTHFFSPIHAAGSPAVARIFHDLQIEAGKVVAWKQEKRIGMSPPGVDGGRINAQAIAAALEVELQKADNLRKLGTSGLRERHLFVIISPENFPALVALRDSHMPEIPPALPHEITHLWAAGWVDENDYSVWRATYRERWQHLGLVTVKGENNEDAV